MLLTDEEKAIRKEKKRAALALGRARLAEKRKLQGENAKPKLPGIYEVKRIGTYGFVFANFKTGKHFWVHSGKTTDRQETIDVFESHAEQYPWKMGSMDNNRRIPTWLWDKVEDLQYLEHATGKVHDVEDIERIVNAERSRASSQPQHDWFIVTPKGLRVEFRVGNGLFGKLQRDCMFKNAQDVAADSVRALWPNRTIRLDLAGDGFEKLNAKPVAVIDKSPISEHERDITKVSGITSGKLDKPIVGSFAPKLETSPA